MNNTATPASARAELKRRATHPHPPIRNTGPAKAAQQMTGADLRALAGVAPDAKIKGAPKPRQADPGKKIAWALALTKAPLVTGVREDGTKIGPFGPENAPFKAAYRQARIDLGIIAAPDEATV